jgi:ClpP class serine protease
MTLWLLEPSICRLMMTARQDCQQLEQAAAWEARELAAEASGAGGVAANGVQLPRGMTIAGATAELRVEGVLTKKPDFFAMFFGGGNTTYSTIRAAIGIAAMTESIKNVVLRIDSPGGSVDGLFEAMEALASFRASSGRKTSVLAENAQSAAYGLAAAFGPIEAVSRGATFGSIGTAASFYLSDHVVTLTNTDSPDKRPDLRTPEGKAVIVKYLDQINDEFARGIAQGRGVTAKDVIEGYGRGASMTAPEAKRLGLIDKIASTTAPRAAPSKQGKAMAEEQTPETRAAIDAAVARGVEQERDRVKAHLQMGESCGDMSIALEAIRSGAVMTQEFTARYMSAGMNRADRTKRQGDATTAETALKGVESATPATGADLGDQIVARLEVGKGFVHV